MHFPCAPRPARYPEVSAAILALEDHRGSIFSGHPVKIAETAHPPRPVSSPGRAPVHERRTVALLNIIYLPTGGGSENPRRYQSRPLSKASRDPGDPICSMLFRPALGPPHPSPCPFLHPHFSNCRDRPVRQEPCSTEDYRR